MAFSGFDSWSAHVGDLELQHNLELLHVHGNFCWLCTRSYALHSGAWDGRSYVGFDGAPLLAKAAKETGRLVSAD